MQRKRIFVALSGGVDSAVTAALLQRQGHDVHGVYLKYASEIVTGFVNINGCSWQHDLAFVRAVAKHLKIPVRTLNVEREYNDAVIATFLREYEQGRTPNPDILCNRDVKFGVFLRWAKNHGADAIATGHYARTDIRSGQRVLLAGVDRNKDQSYFLYTLGASELNEVYFPIGNLSKPQVRALAQRFGLPNAERPDSQGVCFVGDLNVRKFLEHFIPSRLGPIMTSDGHVVGQHHGLSYFTIGQRHGLGVGGGTPYYVAAKDARRNALIVAQGAHDPLLYHQALVAGNLTWVAGSPPGEGFTCQARIRYRQSLEDAVVQLRGDGTAVASFTNPQRAITPGQAIVFYRGDLVLGGATIDHVLTPLPQRARAFQPS